MNQLQQVTEGMKIETDGVITQLPFGYNYLLKAIGDNSTRSEMKRLYGYTLRVQKEGFRTQWFLKKTGKLIGFGL